MAKSYKLSVPLGHRENVKTFSAMDEKEEERKTRPGAPEREARATNQRGCTESATHSNLRHEKQKKFES